MPKDAHSAETDPEESAVPRDQIRGKTAIVTGASRGIGRATTVELARAGANVVAAARTMEPDPTIDGSLVEVADSLSDDRELRVLPVACDLSSDEDIDQLVEQTMQTFGPVDVLVNNAAVTVPGAPGTRRRHDAAASSGNTIDAVRLQFQVNLFAPWRLGDLVLPGMLERGTGTILNVGSEAARMPNAPPAYGASKLAMEFLTRSLAQRVEGTGVNVYALIPSEPISTPGLRWVAASIEGAPPGLIADATMRLVRRDLVPDDPVVYSHDVLEPEHPGRGWLGLSSSQ